MNASTSWFILTITCYLSMVMVDEKIKNDIKMHLHHGPFWRPCGTGAIQTASLEQHVQGYPGSPWTLPLGNYLLRIATATATATANKTMTKNGPTLLAILMAVAVRWYNTALIAWWRRSRALVEATGCHHWASIVADSIQGIYLRRFLLMFFIVNRLKMGA